ncbi:MAG: MFS transporter [Bacillota bacterium]|nr:MFS transporter [Bacillota bacterium]
MNKEHQQTGKGVSIFVLLLMSSITFVAILSEMVPAGILGHLSEGLGISQAQAGQMIGIYALASAICAIPLVTATMHINRKKLLLSLLFGFAVSNLLVGLVSNYYVVLAMRVIGGVAAGILWAMISAYGMKLVPEDQHGRAIAIIMAGSTLGVSLGMPAMTWVGNTFGWRVEFMVLGGFIVLIGVLCQMFLPSVDGERVTSSNNPISLLKNKHVLLILLLTLLGVMAHYASYTYVTELVSKMALPGGVEVALLLFGVGSLTSVILAMKFTDTALRSFVSVMFGIGAVALLAIYLWPSTPWIGYVAFLLWGISFGPLVTMLQAGVARHSASAKAIATSMQSSMFNFSIMIATSVGGQLISGEGGNIMNVVLLSVVLLVPATLLSFRAKETLGDK